MWQLIYFKNLLVAKDLVSQEVQPIEARTLNEIKAVLAVVVLVISLRLIFPLLVSITIRVVYDI